jgi:hypothetical protein
MTRFAVSVADAGAANICEWSIESHVIHNSLEQQLSYPFKPIS